MMSLHAFVFMERDWAITLHTVCKPYSRCTNTVGCIYTKTRSHRCSQPHTSFIYLECKPYMYAQVVYLDCNPYSFHTCSCTQVVYLDCNPYMLTQVVYIDCNPYMLTQVVYLDCNPYMLTQVVCTYSRLQAMYAHTSFIPRLQAMLYMCTHRLYLHRLQSIHAHTGCTPRVQSILGTQIVHHCSYTYCCETTVHFSTLQLAVGLWSNRITKISSRAIGQGLQMVFIKYQWWVNLWRW